MFDIKIEGLDDAIKELKEMSQGLTEEGINEYCEQIIAYSKDICKLENDELTLHAVKKGDNISIAFKSKGSKLECVKKAIQAKLHSMPITTKALFEELIKSIEEKESENIVDS